MKRSNLLSLLALPLLLTNHTTSLANSMTDGGQQGKQAVKVVKKANTTPDKTVSGTKPVGGGGQGGSQQDTTIAPSPKPTKRGGRQTDSLHRLKLHNPVKN